MTIKEIEARSGMSRANIRFYESEGLLEPVRGENGYRDYSEVDLETLRRILLLRTLHIPLEDIRAAQTGEKELYDILDGQLSKLSGEKDELERSVAICRKMRDDNVRYQSLNAGKYLNEVPVGAPPAKELMIDRKQRVKVPWRRFFARMLDYLLCEAAFAAAVPLLFRVSLMRFFSSPYYGLIDAFASIIIMLLAEPLLLWAFKTTPGKLIMGLHVTDEDGGRLPYKKGFVRTAGALWRGMGMCLPIYELVRLYKSYRSYDDGDQLSWEYESELTAKPASAYKNILRTIAVAAVGIVTALLIVFADKQGSLPPHRGDVTLAQLADNYNRAAAYYGYEAPVFLDDEGGWAKRENAGTMIIETENGVRYDVLDSMPELSYTLTDGCVTGVVLHYHSEGEKVLSSGAGFAECLFLTKALVEAKDPKVSLFKSDINDLLSLISDDSSGDLERNVNGFYISRQTEQYGYDFISDGMLFGGADCRYDLTFVIEQVSGSGSK